jgi:hypothetical protein
VIITARFVLKILRFYICLPFKAGFECGKLLRTTILAGSVLNIASGDRGFVSIERSRARQTLHRGISSSIGSSSGDSTVARITIIAGFPHRQRKGLGSRLRAVVERHRPQKPPWPPK